ncbi:hypothetical protein Q9R08_05135 [Microbacterium sp. QXD-8]|uniref:Uncharacterized protein n=1 Tax=Microbacterium psychrotolerans TaxID=3068321 RepID=A0ABU0YYF6_9MICO|nr:hypothetical protein [Microbacterium sp. QXD-8]MDQ7877357.1 hypothetical protein [Microbacterium sp. QXD-8]
MRAQRTFLPGLAADAVRVGDRVAYSFGRCDFEVGDPYHVHRIECLFVWHDCDEVLGEGTVAPGCRWGWRPTGVGAHTLVSLLPLTLTASLFWPDCCGLHGFITNGVWTDA